MSKARSPREVCSTTIGTRGLMGRRVYGAPSGRPRRGGRLDRRERGIGRLKGTGDGGKGDAAGANERASPQPRPDPTGGGRGSGGHRRPDAGRGQAARPGGGAPRPAGA